MKILKVLLLIIVIAIVGLLAYAKTCDNDFSVEESIIINKNITETFDYVKLFSNQIEYSPWDKMDPGMKRTFTGVDGTVGSTHSWESENPDVGYGTMTVNAIEPNKRIDWTIAFTKPFEAVSPAYMTTEIIDANTTKVTWGSSGNIPFPMNVMVASVKKDLGGNFANGLSDLKSILEN